MSDAPGWLDAFQVLGSIVGIVTAIAYFGEKFTADHPVVVIDRKDNRLHAKPIARLTIRNRASRPILLELPGGGVGGGYFKVARDDTAHGIVTAVVRGETIALDASEERSYLLIKPVDFEGLDEESYMHAVVKWRFAQPILWHGNRKAVAVIRKADYRLLFSDGAGLADED